jgi:hypothetical protein
MCRPCRQKLRQRICEQCGNPFEAGGAPRPGAPRRFCSKDCRVANRTKYTHRRAASKASTRRRKAQHRDTWDGITDEQIYERDGYMCQIPGCDLGLIRRDLKFPEPLSPSIDHIVPTSRLGPDTEPNKRAAHLTCNLHRGAAIRELFDPDVPPVRPRHRKPANLPEPRRLYHRPCRWCPAIVTSTRQSKGEFTVCRECSRGKCSRCGADMPIVVNSRPPETRRCNRCPRGDAPVTNLWWTTVRPDS